ncbi:hypothetical protein PASE110613_01820 [Paenibacillus sediminis]|uniref:Uncharacterized protein n=1 Tax=Paenibacillus sediminis TaxID=664909 RepID=A0ABS4H064_9BACL|nr:hypothetical protein [Paenibacillus sediminis]MBP1935677.1 hypothetical protein [Paenibacillus sediminis]
MDDLTDLYFMNEAVMEGRLAQNKTGHNPPVGVPKTITCLSRSAATAKMLTN